MGHSIKTNVLSKVNTKNTGFFPQRTMSVIISSKFHQGLVWTSESEWMWREQVMKKKGRGYRRENCTSRSAPGPPSIALVYQPFLKDITLHNSLKKNIFFPHHKHDTRKAKGECGGGNGRIWKTAINDGIKCSVSWNQKSWWQKWPWFFPFGTWLSSLATKGNIRIHFAIIQGRFFSLCFLRIPYGPPDSQSNLTSVPSFLPQITVWNCWGGFIVCPLFKKKERKKAKVPG